MYVNAKKNIFIFYARHMKYIFNVSSWRKHAEMICCLFSLERDMKVHFFLNEAFFFIFSHLLSQLFRQFFASRVGNSSDFPFLCFSFEDGDVEMCRMKFSFHEIHVNVPDNMNLNSLFLLRFLSSPCNILYFLQQNSTKYLKIHISITISRNLKLWLKKNKNIFRKIFPGFI